MCLEATAILVGFEGLMPVNSTLLPPNINELVILRWDNASIVARAQTALCAETTINIQLLTNEVTGNVTPKADCTGAKVDPQGMRMIDGHRAGLAAHGR
jgi:hypothetical protein